jgi:hypothetical protein
MVFSCDRVPKNLARHTSISNNHALLTVHFLYAETLLLFILLTLCIFKYRSSRATLDGHDNIAASNYCSRKTTATFGLAVVKLPGWDALRYSCFWPLGELEIDR